MNIVFVPKNHKFQTDAEEYSLIWKDQGVKILSTIKKISNLSPIEEKIKAIIYEGISFSGKNILSPMKLRASYSKETKKATLIHELLHRFLFRLKLRLGLNEHQVLNLILYDILSDLYGVDFANSQVEIESKRKGLFDYQKTWQNSLSTNRSERQKKWCELLKTNNLL